MELLFRPDRSDSTKELPIGRLIDEPRASAARARAQLVIPPHCAPIMKLLMPALPIVLADSAQDVHRYAFTNA